MHEFSQVIAHLVQSDLAGEHDIWCAAGTMIKNRPIPVYAGQYPIVKAGKVALNGDCLDVSECFGKPSREKQAFSYTPDRQGDVDSGARASRSGWLSSVYPRMV